MKTMMNLNELAAVVGGNDILEFDVNDIVLSPEFTNISLDGIDFYIHGQFQPLPESMNLTRNTKSDPECRIVWTDNGGGGR